MKLKDAVYVLRSKNAGVWHITIDIMFKNKDLYERAKKTLNKTMFMSIYNKEKLQYFECDNINTIKISFLRNSSAGNPRERDCLGALQYIPLLNLEI